ncbi:uroplakin-1b-like [Brienomyrus brachyistius]|uniref:uroplakin-1b-like n=1 Tax=Brienomyrus brachyistius TaxID=42636 RepID=UPI0020B38F4F|nr:uroplakin-1b-like [Brienomyrus brachyistius]XP_048839777.1 uroplakin-1b-like [Brienomyrus brachyistius]
MSSQPSFEMRLLQAVLLWGNFVIMCCGIALMAMCIFFVYDRDHLHTLVYYTGSDSIWRAAWIGIFTGFALFCVAAYAMYAIMKEKKIPVLVYIILMMIVFAFEMASAITAATHEDWFGPEIFLTEMLQKYDQQVLPNNTNDMNQVQEITNAWNQLMIEKSCCGVNGPQDWLTYNSSFRQQYSDASYPWPMQCCQQNAMGGIVQLRGCQIGVNPYLSTTGCYAYIAGPIMTQGLAVSWFGFAILCWVFFVLLGMMFYYTQID